MSVLGCVSLGLQQPLTQLCAPTDYLCNVISALDVIPTPDLLVASKLVGAPSEEFAPLAMAEKSNHPELVELIAGLRGLS